MGRKRKARSEDGGGGGGGYLPARPNLLSSAPAAPSAAQRANWPVRPDRMETRSRRLWSEANATRRAQAWLAWARQSDQAKRAGKHHQQQKHQQKQQQHESARYASRGTSIPLAQHHCITPHYTGMFVLNIKLGKTWGPFIIHMDSFIGGWEAIFHVLSQYYPERLQRPRGWRRGEVKEKGPKMVHAVDNLTSNPGGPASHVARLDATRSDVPGPHRTAPLSRLTMRAATATGCDALRDNCSGSGGGCLPACLPAQARTHRPIRG